MRAVLVPGNPSSGAPTSLGLPLYVGIGLLAGALYVAFDIVSEGRISAGTLRGAWASVHNVVDHLLPVLAGALLGVAAHYARIRSCLAEAEVAASRAEQLRVRLHKVERDQAVWVLAAAVLHELNNPLHAIGLALDELDVLQDDRAERAGLIARIRAQSDRALTKLRTLRSMRGMGEPDIGPVSLPDVLHTLAFDLGSLAQSEGISVKIECDRPVRANADPDYLRTIVENLVDNSLHALREGGGTVVTLSIDTDGDRAILRVHDDGPRSALDESVFEPLQTSKQRGLGLGLAISRALARAMRGDLVLDRQNGFRLELPAQVSP
jgi:signal transduction histidine kinase